MSKYLKSIESYYGSDLSNRKCVREVATLCLYLLQSGEVKINANGVGKVILVESGNFRINDSGAVMTCTHPLRHLNLITSDATDLDIKRAFIDETLDILVSMGSSRSWDVGAFDTLKKKIEQREFRFFGSLGRAKFNNSKQKSAVITWNTNDYINIGIDVKNKTDHSVEWIKVISIGIGLGLFESICGMLEWENENTVRMYHTNKRDYWSVDVTSHAVTFHYPRAEGGDPHGQYDLARMYIDGWLVEKNTDTAKEWLLKSAAQGFGRAIKLLEQIQSGKGVPPDPIKNSLK